ncbi:hypothetical protein Pedsa_0698 [Pseudopedobacter saltans DSM 12145]|uniref:T9SS C-terminal target domain-containing protein n=1 Tax=Pseudopedobacter saltans (strain ATCC 51119 / DSM 12145 / JCM 21818 / CCUG 39354 / LMG 10337 / NBRC 100064 / NCIMB 13643) TaxID=762903 RepID=F0S8J0_PSESL|nr:hypothetical protein [Pseudopedobacter saltans]ADY51274.1 hypothetical protein Pedsa_0698 [Pseudopedobacter saltans DSM 12145]
MKKLLLITTFIGLLNTGKAQTYWKADVANSKGDVIWDYSLAVPAAKSIQEINVNSESTPDAEGFLPKPPSGTVAVRTYTSTNPDPNTSPAGFSLSGNTSPSLTMIATSGPSNAGPSATAATSKFAAYGFANATNVMSLHFNMTLGVEPSNSKANWYFMIGGNSYPGILTNQGNMVTSTAETAAGVYAHDNRIFGAYRLNKSSEGGDYVHTTMGVTSITAPGGRTWSGAVDANLAANTAYKIDIFCNNSTATVKYIHPGTGAETDLAAGKYVIYINEDLKGTFNKLEVTTSQNLRSFMIMSRDAAQSGSVLDNSASLTISNFKVVHLGTISTNPVNLTSFIGKATNSGIALNWQTASEQNNSHFILSRSSNGKDFSYLTRVEGNGTSNNVNHYSYIDRAPFAGVNYYQLEQVDKDGTKTVNKSLYVNYKSTDADFVVSRSSNNNLKTTLNASRIEWSEIIITDIAGKVIYKGKHLLSEGKNEIEVPLSGSKQMVSVVYVQTATESKSAKLIL